MENEDQANVDFTCLLLDAQRSLYAYILSLNPSTDDAKDVLQQTNLVLLNKRAEFDPQKNFGAWAARIAYFEMLAHRKAARARRMLFDDGLVQALADEGASDVSAEDPQLRALSDCFERLPAADQALVKQRYHEGKPARDIAAAVGRSSHAIAQSLYRIRVALLQCIERRLRAVEAS